MNRPSQCYQTSAAGHRGSLAVQRLVELAPASGSLALWMLHRDVGFVDTQSGHQVSGIAGTLLYFDGPIANDGTHLFYGQAFEALSLPRQMGLLAHQILHVALRHAPRQQALAHVHGQVDSELFNVCADAIVNSTLTHLDWLELPPRAVFLDTLLERVLGIREPVSRSLQRWDTESLYRAIDDRERRQGGAASQGKTSGASGGTAAQGSTSTSHAQAGQPGDARNTGANASTTETERSRGAGSKNVTSSGGSAPGGKQIPDPTDGPRAALARAMLDPHQRDLLAADVAAFEAGNAAQAPTKPGDGAYSAANSISVAAEHTRRWSDRLARVQAADGEQSILRVALADRPSQRTPWQQVLRARLSRSLAPIPELSWSRPSRSYLANRGRTASGRRMPWEPGTSGNRAVPRLVIIVDVSGSVELPLLNRFTTEIDRLMKLHRAQAMLIIGDDRVRSEVQLKPGCQDIRTVEFRGGGGTDLTPLLKAADHHRPDIVLCLTDLQGPIEFTPAWPVVWAVPQAFAHSAVPFGSVLVLG